MLGGGTVGILQGISENCVFTGSFFWRFMTPGGLTSSENCQGFQNVCLNIRKIILQCSLERMKPPRLHEQSKEAGFVGLHYQSLCPASDCSTVFYQVYRCKADPGIWYLIWDLAGGWTERMAMWIQFLASTEVLKNTSNPVGMQSTPFSACDKTLLFFSVPFGLLIHY